jgi:hypothetical protein
MPKTNARKFAHPPSHQQVYDPVIDPKVVAMCGQMVSPVVVDAITDMLMTQQNIRRPPEKAAALLALLVELNRKGQPFPKRHEVAEALDCSVYTIDAVLSTRINEGYLQQVVETTTGNVSARNSIVRQRFYVPSQELVAVADRALRKQKVRTK